MYYLLTSHNVLKKNSDAHLTLAAYHIYVYMYIKSHFCNSFQIDSHFADISTDFADCMTGEVRLTKFSDNTEEDSRQGTIQICINNAWGSVCSDDFFDSVDAAVFCKQLPGFNTNGTNSKRQ